MANQRSHKSTVETGRTAEGRFTSGNPGRPRGARNKATQALEALLDGEAEALGRKAVELALKGDTIALRLCLERILPPRKSAATQFPLPGFDGSREITTAISSLIDAVTSGEVSPSDASEVAKLVEVYRRAVETEDLEKRVEALERRRSK